MNSKYRKNRNPYFTNEIPSIQLQLLVNDYGNWHDDNIYFEFHNIIGLIQNEESCFVITENGKYELDLRDNGYKWEMVEDGILIHHNYIYDKDELEIVNGILLHENSEFQLEFLNNRKRVLSLHITT